MKQTTVLRRAFNAHRSGARGRGVSFHFTFEEWCDWWESHLGPDWFEKRGNKRNQYVMARRGDAGPYHPDNVKCIVAQANTYEIRRSPDHMERMRASIGPRKSKYDR